MDGLIPFVLKALKKKKKKKKKKKGMKHYRSLSSADHLAQHADVTELSPQGSFMTPQHPRAPRWHGHGGDRGDMFMSTPQHPRAPRWLDDEDRGNGEPALPPAAAVPAAMARAKSSNTRRLPITETSPLRYSGSYHGGK